MRQGLVLIPIAAALALSAAAAAGCSACRGPVPLPLVGVVGYAILLAVAIWRPDHAIVRLGLVAASGLHIGLVGAMAARGSLCSLCIGTAGCCLAATWLSLHRIGWQLVPLVMPWTAALALTIQPDYRPVNPETTELRVVAYVKAGCRYCDQLHDEVMPEAVRGLGVKVEYRDADTVDFIDQIPTVVVSRGDSIRVFEGLPDPADLRRGIQTLQGDMP